MGMFRGWIWCVLVAVVVDLAVSCSIWIRDIGRMKFDDNCPVESSVFVIAILPLTANGSNINTNTNTMEH